MKMLPHKRTTQVPTLPPSPQREDEFFLVSPLGARLPPHETRPSAMGSYRSSGLANPFPLPMGRSRSPGGVGDFIGVGSSPLILDPPILPGALFSSTLSEREPTGGDRCSPQHPPLSLLPPAVGNREDMADLEETETATSMECESPMVATGPLRHWRLCHRLVPTDLSSALIARLCGVNPFVMCCYATDHEVCMIMSCVPIIDDKHVMGTYGEGTHNKDGNDEASPTMGDASTVEYIPTTNERSSACYSRRPLRFRPSGQDNIFLGDTSINYFPSSVFGYIESDEIPASPLLDQLTLPSF